MKELKQLEIIAKQRADNFEPCTFADTKDILAIAYAFRALEQRAEAAEAKLAEYEKQEPVACGNEKGFAWYQNLDGTTAKPTGEYELFTGPAPAADLAELVPSVCDGKEQEAFESYARQKGLDLSRHPLHYLFLDGKNNQARSAWRECLVYVRAAILRSIEQAK